MNFGPGDMIRKGDVLWAGRTITGDHVFVDKIRWNFMKPQRGQVVVFSTKDIPTLPPGTHYIKRLIALPDEIISIVPPNILINGTRITTPAEIERIQRQEPGYSAGYIPAGFSGEDAFLARAGDTKRIPTGRYFALGDNTTNSRDSRYWGTIPAENMVGPAVCVYWPFRSHWGRIR
jgi:signal peptidase I